MNSVAKKGIDYKSAGVDIDVANEALERIKAHVKRTFTPAVLTDIGSFGAMVDLRALLKSYRHPVLVQSIDGVGTKMIVARMMNQYNTIGFDLLAATCNDIVVHGAKPLTFLDYIANDRLRLAIIEEIISGLTTACEENGIALVGGEIAEMPDTYLPGEHDLVGVVTGVVEKEQIITGETIQPEDILLGLLSSGLHTNGYSLARKLFFEVGDFNVNSHLPELGKTIGETLLEPHINYTKPILSLLDASVLIKGIAHITGGGFLENIPRVLPEECSVEIQKGSWPIPPVFSVMQNLGKIDEQEMYRTFNMGIGLVLIVQPDVVDRAMQILKQFETPSYRIGRVSEGKQNVHFIE